MRALLLLFGLSACGATDSGGADAGNNASADASNTGGPDAGNNGGPDAAQLDDCEVLFGAPPENRAGLDLMDHYNGEEEATLRVSIDGCSFFSGDEDRPRGGLYGRGFLPGEHTLRVSVDGVELVSTVFSAAHGDALWYSLDNQSPPQLHAARAPVLGTPAGWSLHIMNVTGQDMDLYRVVDPDVDPREYELLMDGLPHGETFSREFSVSAQTGVWLRMDVEDEVVFEDNILFIGYCDPGEWVGGFHSFVTVANSAHEDEPPSYYPEWYIIYPYLPCQPL